jgi:hypothetical protein
MGRTKPGAPETELCPKSDAGLDVVIEDVGCEVSEDAVSNAKATREVARNVQRHEGIRFEIVPIEAVEVLTCDAHQARWSDGTDRRRARLHVHERHLAEGVFWTEDGDTMLAVFAAALQDLDLALENDEHVVGGFAFAKDGVSGLNPEALECSGEVVEDLIRKSTE